MSRLPLSRLQLPARLVRCPIGPNPPGPMKQRLISLAFATATLLPLAMLNADIRVPDGLPKPSTAVPEISSAPAPKAGYEWPAVLSASKLISPELLNGPAHRIQERVATDGYMAHFMVESDYGTFECVGIEQLGTTVREVYAIQRLKEVSRSEVFKAGLKRSIEQPIDAAKNIIRNPVAAAKTVPKSIGHMFKKFGRALSSAASDAEEKQQAGGSLNDELTTENAREAGRQIGKAAKGILGFDTAKLACARQLQVDPYSDNPVLQQEMDNIAWVYFSGGLPLQIGAASASAGASRALSATTFVGLPDEIYSQNESELTFRNSEAMIAMKVPDRVQRHFASNPALTTTVKRSIIKSLTLLKDVSGKPGVIELAATSADPRQAEFLDRSLRILAARQAAGASRYAGVIVLGQLIGGIDSDGRLHVPAPVDYLSWTEEVAEFARRDDLIGQKPVLLLSGDASPLARTELAANGWTVGKP